MADNFDDVFKRVLDLESSPFDNPIDYNGRSYQSDDDDDTEDVLTSEEINPKLDKRARGLGLVGTGDGVIEEETYYKRYTSTYEHKYTEKELSDMRASCIGTIVHDYSENDPYHMSDEERANADMLNEISGKLSTVKGTYRKVDQWIDAMRTVVQAWEMLEDKSNYIHTKKEFFEMVAAGKIVSNRIILPKLKRMNSYNMETLIKYISNPELDPADLLPITTPSMDDWYASLDSEEDEETDEERTFRLLSKEDLLYIKEYQDNPEEFKVKEMKPKFIKGYDKKTFTSNNKKKKKGKKNKTEEYMKESLHDLLNKIQNDPNNRPDSDYYGGRSFMVTNSMFDPVKPPKNFFDEMKFDGSWASDNDTLLYDLVLREEALKQHPSRSRYMTYGDQELQKFFKALEEHGVNTLSLRRKMDVPVDGGSIAIEEKATKKENKKMESILIQRITQLNNDPKFKKIVTKAENALNKQYSEY